VLLTITKTDQGLRVEGELDIASAPELSQALRDIDAPANPVVLDFSEVSFMDSSGLRALLEAAESMDGSGPLVLLHPPSNVRRVLEISLPGGVAGLEIRD
jgi:anti-anti-sigma factor